MRYLLIVIVSFFFTGFSIAQEDSLNVADTTIYRIVKYDGVEFIGKIVSRNAREVLVLTEERGPIYVPQHVIKEISIVNQDEYNPSGEYVGEDMFATRYFITTNGLPIKKGHHYVQWNWFGPDFQFGVGDNFGVGFMTSWMAVPIIGTVKYSFQLSDKSQFALGALVGTTSWAAMTEPELNIGGFLPFGTYSYGTRRANIAFSAGYGTIWENRDWEGRGLGSIAGMVKVGPRFSLVFDSFGMLPGKTTYETYDYYQYNPSTGTDELVTITEEVRNPGLLLIIPGIRWHQSKGKAFQFGFAGLAIENEIMPFPVPMIQWYRRL